MRTSNGERFLWLLTGVGFGAGFTYLFGTKNGRKARRAFVRYAEEGRERITEGGQEILDKWEDFYERGREMVDEAMEYVERSRRAVLE